MTKLWQVRERLLTVSGVSNVRIHVPSIFKSQSCLKKPRKCLSKGLLSLTSVYGGMLQQSNLVHKQTFSANYI